MRHGHLYLWGRLGDDDGVKGAIGGRWRNKILPLEGHRKESFHNNKQVNYNAKNEVLLVWVKLSALWACHQSATVMGLRIEYLAVCAVGNNGHPHGHGLYVGDAKGFLQECGVDEHVQCSETRREQGP